MKHLKYRNAFTLIELLFVIVIMGIVGGLAIESMRQYYDGIYRTGEYTKRVAEADHILEQIAGYFENAISSSIIRLDEDNAVFGSQCVGVPKTGDDNKDYTIAFVAVDSDGLRGYWDNNSTRWRPGWSSNGTSLGHMFISSDSNYTAMDNMAQLDQNDATRAAIFRSDGVGEGVDECHRYGWAPTLNTNDVYGRILSVVSDHNITLDQVISTSGETNRGYLMRTAYAFRARDGVFNMYSGFEPWNGERYSSVSGRLLGDKVTHFAILYDNSNMAINSNIGNVYTLKICMQGVDENLSDSNVSINQICRERIVHVRY
ncbi:type II secretion system protein [Sulfuricurvum sp.]|uniref:type II secretion system protein n=1 Tax=Sulfuricurvum sp. TaxID=2025608 RepID=UPI002624C2E3|nr:type II secretion system protein [Sulfuricurvum sp.]MDD4885023.1 type II secretion system protein [Sulfuricurvum sp.]